MCLSITSNDPTRLLAKGEHKEFQWEVTHNGYGIRCGYVRVPKGHSWWGKNYNEIETECHGGLTFAEKDEPCAQGNEADDGWWVGFDCGHGFDLPDPTLQRGYIDPLTSAFLNFNDSFVEPMLGITCKDTTPQVRTQEYVENECRSLCEQAAKAGGGDGVSA